MARGNFSTTLYAALSRTQVEFGGPSTFGLEIARTDHFYPRDGSEPATGGSTIRSSFSLGKMIERGCFNYRFPFNEYYLDLHPGLDSEIAPAPAATGLGTNTTTDTRSAADRKHVGLCQMFSCAMDGMFYQVLRIAQGGHIGDGLSLCRHFPGKSQVVLTFGGPLWFRTFDKDRLHVHDLNEQLLHPACPPAGSA